MTDTAGSSQKDHRGGNLFRQNHGIVTRAANHAMCFATRLLRGLLDLIRQKWIHGNRRLFQQYFSLHG